SIRTNNCPTCAGAASGSHTVTLSGVAGNCSVNGGNSRTVTVPAGGTAPVSFSVSCAAITGTLTVTTSTSGGTPDPDGYTVTVSGGGGGSQHVGTKDRKSVEEREGGKHRVRLREDE